MGLIPNEVNNIMKKNNGAIEESLFDSYSPHDKNNRGENLLTIYLNNGIGVHYVSKFVEKGYEIQLEKVYPERWDVLIKALSQREDFEGLLTNLLNPKGLPETNTAYELLKLPTRYKFALFSRVHKPGNIYVTDKHDIMEDVFSINKISFDLSTDIKKWKETMTDMVKCLKFLCRGGFVPRESIQKIDTPEFKKNFLNHLFYLHESIWHQQGYKRQMQMAQATAQSFNLNGKNVQVGGAAQQAMGATGAPTITFEVECANFLKNIRSALEKEFFDHQLTKKPEEANVKKAHRGKI